MYKYMFMRSTYMFFNEYAFCEDFILCNPAIYYCNLLKETYD
jgi:hypothetical protein